MGTTKIEWCNKSWNIITGCSSVSEGCQNCYAKRMAYRLKGRYGYPKDDPFKVNFHPDRLEEPLHWKKPSRIFVCSMGDLFHESVHFEWIEAIWDTIFNCSFLADKGQLGIIYHIFLILTKRPQRILIFNEWMKKYRSRRIDYKNLWLGISVENQRTADERIPILCQIPASIKFVSVEPMLEDIHFYRGWFGVNGIDWVICGGETGPKARSMHPDWARSVRDQCRASGVPFFFKSMGDFERNKTKCPCGCRKKKLSENMIPQDLMIREFPT